MSDIEDMYVRDVSMVLDNEEGTQSKVREAVMEAVRNDCGYVDLPADEYALLYRQREHEFYGTVGLAVRDAVYDIMDLEGTTGVSRQLIEEFLNGLTDALGEKYVPDPDDYAEFWGEEE